MQTPDELLLAARASSLREDHRQALALCVAALQQRPGDPQGVAFLGLSLWRARNFAQAVDVLQEALKRFPAQYELSLALLESLRHLGREEQALSFAATLPESVRSQRALQTRLEELQVSVAGLRPAATVQETLLSLHEEGDFETLERRLPALLRDYPRWHFGQTLLASCLFMSSGRMLTAQSLCIPSAAEPAAQAEGVVRRQMRRAMSAARQRVMQQIGIAIARSPENAHARELLIRTRFEEGEAIEDADVAHISAQVQSALIGPFPLTPVFDESLQGMVEFRRIEPASIVEIPAPRSVGARPLDLTGAIGPALLCARYVADAAGATVCAGSDIVLLPNGRVLGDNLTHPLGELVNYHFDAWIVMGSVSQLVLRELPTDSVPGTVISLLGAAVRFYGHWLLDTLIRFRSLEQHPAAATASLLVEDDMPETHIEALQLLLGPGRAIHRVAKGRCASAERLLLAGPEVFFPHVLRYGAPSLPSVAPSAVGGLIYLRGRMHAAVGGSRAPRGSRLLVRRRSSTRRVVNEDLLSEMLVGEWGFEELHPETLSFAEQVRRFRDADVVVGAQGSAMSNCVFCTPGARVVSLCSTFAANFPSWAHALEQLGVGHCFVVGEAVADSHPLLIQRDIHVDPSQLLQALGQLGVPPVQ
ncbi:capsular polysaccharide biosynthesis protein/thioredoxin-like negative regulator of GroEL [Pelomonas saccharophila]|uniref:Capsular polysaccharide biosynthesis protein/thioredoxin-like negative regulator of GroEL n=1 Tax=Roseateles saccharophilus TaxID=304 RepID=A0ABU1YSQ2_ROSSA|nr:glycosyltransferase 61 family protein [Roseateles saccharophilus]MDR7271887.1 capsular polysaccharide biosynthesis protein/thioredoxin-like negative regulator of GroEL [Roseateles saccharophilus]